MAPTPIQHLHSAYCILITMMWGLCFFCLLTFSTDCSCTLVCSIMQLGYYALISGPLVHTSNAVYNAEFKVKRQRMCLEHGQLSALSAAQSMWRILSCAESCGAEEPKNHAGLHTADATRCSRTCWYFCIQHLIHYTIQYLDVLNIFLT